MRERPPGKGSVAEFATYGVDFDDGIYSMAEGVAHFWPIRYSPPGESRADSVIRLEPQTALAAAFASAACFSLRMLRQRSSLGYGG